MSRPGGEQADFFTIVAWERQAEICAQYLTIGRRIAVEGRMHHSSWNEDDAPRSKVEVIAHRVQLLGARPTITDTDSQASGDVEATRESEVFA